MARSRHTMGDSWTFYAKQVTRGKEVARRKKKTRCRRLFSSPLTVGTGSQSHRSRHVCERGSPPQISNRLARPVPDTNITFSRTTPRPDTVRKRISLRSDPCDDGPNKLEHVRHCIPLDLWSRVVRTWHPKHPWRHYWTAATSYRVYLHNVMLIIWTDPLPIGNDDLWSTCGNGTRQKLDHSIVMQMSHGAHYPHGPRWSLICLLSWPLIDGIREYATPQITGPQQPVIVTCVCARTRIWTIPSYIVCTT